MSLILGPGDQGNFPVLDYPRSPGVHYGSRIQLQTKKEGMYK